MKLSYFSAFFGFVLLFQIGCTSKSATPAATAAAAKAPDPIAVRTVTAEMRKIDRSIALTGSLQADEQVTVGFEVPGRISRLLVDFGMNVKKGQVIGELDRREYELQRDRAQAALNTALARLGLTLGQEDTPAENTPAIRQAKAQMEDAQSKFDSAEKLVKSGDISTQRFTEVEKQYRARQAGLDAVQDEVRAQLAQVQALKADLRLVEKRLSDTVVRAPFDGSVSVKHVSAGQYVKDNAPVVTLVKTWPLRLRTEIPESATAAAKVGATLTFTTDAVPGKEFHAVVRELNPVLDARTRTLIAEARLVESDQRLRAGAFVQVKLLTEAGAQVTFVPKQALYQVAGLTKFFVIDNGKAVERRFVPGVENAGWVEVPGGLVVPGQQVAISALAALTDGAPVQPQAGRS